MGDCKILCFGLTNIKKFVQIPSNIKIFVELSYIMYIMEQLSYIR